MKEKIKRIFKNPLWIIVILLILMNFLLWKTYKRITSELFWGSEKIVDELGWIYDKLDEINDTLLIIESDLLEIEYNTRY